MPPKKARKPPLAGRAPKKAASRASPRPATKAGARKTVSRPRPRAGAGREVVRKRAQAAKPAAKAQPRKPIRAARPRAVKPAPRRPVVIGIGDEVTFPAPTRVPGAPRTRGSGIVFSIRDIRTGKTVKVATGDMNQYVFEVLDNATFDRGMSSLAAGDPAAARSAAQALLRRLAQHRQTPTLAEAALTEREFAGLDGWRIVKVHSAEIAPPQPTAPLPLPAKKKR